MTGRARRHLLLVFLALVPVTAALVVRHVSARNRLEEASLGRVERRAENIALGVDVRVAEARESVAKIAAPGSERLAELEEAAARLLPPGSEVAVLPAVPPSATLRSDPDHGVVLVVDSALPGNRSLRARIPLRIRPPIGTHPSALTVVDAEGRALWRHPTEAVGRPSDQDRRRVSSLATRILTGDEEPPGPERSARYAGLDDDDVFGSWAKLDGDLGGVIVEEGVSTAFEPISGPRPWHFAVALLVLTGLPLLLLELGHRWSAATHLMRLYTYARPYWKLIALVVVGMGVYAAGLGGQLYMIKLLVEDVLLNRAPDEAWRILILLTVALIVIVVLMAAGRFVKTYFSAVVTQSVINDVRCDVGRHLLTLSLRYYQRRRQGALLSRLTNDVGQSRRALRLIFGDLVEQPLLMAAAVAAGFATNWRLALMVFCAFPFLAYPISRFGKKIKRQAKKRQLRRADVTNVLVQMLSGIRIVKAFRAEEREGERLRKASNQLLKRSKKVAGATASSLTVLELFNHVGGAVILLAGGWFVLHGKFGVSVADLVTFSAILGRMYKPVKDLTKTYNKVQNCLPSIERVFEIMDARPDIEDGADARPLGRPERSIAFERVTFAYDEEPVLQDVSFEAAVGDVIALVGPTGAGKSTLTDLVARFYDPTEGRILIDGVDLRSYAVGSLLSRIAVVTQDPFLFHTTIRDNILYGRPDATEEEIVAAARAAYVHGEIEELPDGYDTVVGERGARLSGGQRQRLTIARAILKDADILILDEATSSLDSRSEGEVQEALANLMVGRTTFVVAHRLSTIRSASRILVLDRGRIVEQGTHDDLLVQGGLYRTLHAMQEAGE
jgi:subfamily B ATP-binding cassette protein MsbA